MGMGASPVLRKLAAVETNRDQDQKQSLVNFTVTMASSFCDQKTRAKKIFADLRWGLTGVWGLGMWQVALRSGGEKVVALHGS